MLNEKLFSKFLIFKTPLLLVFPILKHLTSMNENSFSKSLFDWIIIPEFSENINLEESLQPKFDRSMSKPILFELKHISSKQVIKPPEDISWPDRILFL